MAWDSSTFQVATVASPAIGGLLYAFGPACVYAVSACCDACAAFLLSRIRMRLRVVEIQGLDLQADGGTHVANTREVGRHLPLSGSGKVDAEQPQIRLTGLEDGVQIVERLRQISFRIRLEGESAGQALS